MVVVLVLLLAVFIVMVSFIKMGINIVRFIGFFGLIEKGRYWWIENCGDF